MLTSAVSSSNTIKRAQLTFAGALLPLFTIRKRSQRAGTG